MYIYRYLYFGIIIIIILIIIYLYLSNNESYEYDLIVAKSLETKRNNRIKQILNARKDTTECPIKGLNTPEKCLTQSEYSCKWSIDADRCNQK